MQYREKSAKVEALQFKTDPKGIAEMKEFVLPYILDITDNTESYILQGTLEKLNHDNRTFRVLGYRRDGSIDRINSVAYLYLDSWAIKNKRNPSSKIISKIEIMDDSHFKSKYELI